MEIVPFSNIILRSPCFAFDPNHMENLYNSSVYDEALYLASPELYAEKIKAQQKGKTKNDKKLIISLNKYASRAMTRCTPFGLFAGCSIATIGDINKISLCKRADYTRCTRLDMNYICALVQDLSKNKIIRNQLSYYPNDSLYEFGGRLRYAEYYYKDTRRIHVLSGITSNNIIKDIINTAQKGAYIQELADLIVEIEKVDIDEAIDFIHELINNQILKSELELSVTGDDSLEELIRCLEQIDGIEEIKGILKLIKVLLLKINESPIGSTISLYNEIIAQVKNIGTDYNIKFLFQTDMFKPTYQSIISKSIVQNIISGLNFLNKITSSHKETNILKFKNAFYTRYEYKKVSLMEALDKELGIGYPIGTNVGDKSPLIDGIAIANIMQNDSNIVFNEWDKLLLKKYVKALQEKKTCIELDDEDIKGKITDWSDFPPTFSCMCKIINDQEVYIHSAGGPSAAKLIGRFCHLNKKIETHAKAITSKEQAMNQDAIYAEVVHLPESRIGNILFRPILREYEIPYLCKSSADRDKIIPLSDLVLQIRNGELIIISQRFNKRIIPCLSTAHNYQNNAMPVYRFLCDMQHPIGRNSVYFSWGIVERTFEYIPRVKYKNCIFSLARWAIRKEKIQEWQS